MIDKLPMLAMAVPLVGMPLLWMFRHNRNLREGISLLLGLISFGLVLALVGPVMDGARPGMVLARPLPEIAIQFTVEPLGLMFALIASGLWIVTGIYAAGYMRGNHETHHTRFFAAFSVSISATLGIAFAGNLLTLFIFYEALTLSTYPLVTHKQDEAAKRAGRVYLGTLIGTSIAFLLLAIVWTWVMTGTTEFTPGGILAGKVSEDMTLLLLGLFAFGIGKAALMPFHRWLPAAMVAPTPVSALLHAVAVVKAGVFAIVKIVVYVFGIDWLSATGASTWLQWVAAFSLLAASLIALRQDNLKARLAYSTVSQLSYVTLGAALATGAGIMGAAMHILAHAFGKITLFFCAGAIYTATHRTRISEMDGLGRRMPWTYAAFFVGALSIIGLPPLFGAWSKWNLMNGTLSAGEPLLMLVLMSSSLLSIAYLMPVVLRGWFLPAANPDEAGEGVVEAPWACVIPPLLTALGCIALFFLVDPVQTLLGGMVLRTEATP